MSTSAAISAFEFSKSILLKLVRPHAARDASPGNNKLTLVTLFTLLAARLLSPDCFEWMAASFTSLEKSQKRNGPTWTLYERFHEQHIVQVNLWANVSNQPVSWGRDASGAYRDIGILLDIQIRMRLDDLLDSGLRVGLLPDKRHRVSESYFRADDVESGDRVRATDGASPRISVEAGPIGSRVLPSRQATQCANTDQTLYRTHCPPPWPLESFPRNRSCWLVAGS